MYVIYDDFKFRSRDELRHFGLDVLPSIELNNIEKSVGNASPNVLAQVMCDQIQTYCATFQAEVILQMICNFL